MRIITIDLNLALEYAQAEIGRLMSGGRSSPLSSEILDRIRAQAQLPVEELSDADLRHQVLTVAFRQIRVG